MEYLLIGIAVAFNVIIIIIEFSRGRPVNASLDAGLLGIITYLSSGSFAALATGTVASAIISIYLLIKKPIKFTSEPSDMPLPNKIAKSIDSFLGIN